ncbi:MAG: TonB family protein [Aquincola sp.]|nr:TonB family protein [Aquincola sp.]
MAAQPAITNVSACKPEYPSAALKAEATGTTTIKFSIDAAGKVVSADVVKPSGPSREHRLLDRAAVTSLSGCSFPSRPRCRGPGCRRIDKRRVRVEARVSAPQSFPLFGRGAAAC